MNELTMLRFIVLIMFMSIINKCFGCMSKNTDEDITYTEFLVVQDCDTFNDEKIYTHIDKMPQFPGGEAELMRWIAYHIKYPKKAYENKIQGKVILEFIVTSEGSIDQINVIKKVDPELDNEAIRVIKSLPKFIPGEIDGEPVNVWYTIPINFKLKAEDENVEIFEKKDYDKASSLYSKAVLLEQSENINDAVSYYLESFYIVPQDISIIEHAYNISNDERQKEQICTFANNRLFRFYMDSFGKVKDMIQLRNDLITKQQHLVKLSPNNTDILFNLEYYLFHSKDYEALRKTAKMIYALTEGSDEETFSFAMELEAYSLFDLKDYTSVINLVVPKIPLIRNTSRKGALFVLGETYLTTKQYDKGKELYTFLKESDAENFEGWMNGYKETDLELYNEIMKLLK